MLRYRVIIESYIRGITFGSITLVVALQSRTVAWAKGVGVRSRYIGHLVQLTPVNVAWHSDKVKGHRWD